MKNFKSDYELDQEDFIAERTTRLKSKARSKNKNAGQRTRDLIIENDRTSLFTN